MGSMKRGEEEEREQSPRVFQAETLIQYSTMIALA